MAKTETASVDASVGTPELATTESNEHIVDISAAHRDSNLDEILDQLDRELVGLKPVKAYIRQIASLLLVDKVRQKFGFDAVQLARSVESGKPAKPRKLTNDPLHGHRDHFDR